MASRVLLIGLGQIGMGYDLQLDPSKHVYTHARAFSQHPGFELAAGVDPDPERRRIFETTYDRPAYPDLDAARLHRADVVTIAGPTEAHGNIVRRVLTELTPRAVLCEKPLSYDLTEARSMVQDCADHGVDLFVNYMRRSDPGVIEIRRRLDAGSIRAPVKGVVWYSKGFFHNGSHFFNLAEYWLGPMLRAEVLERGRKWNGTDPEPDVRVVFSRGTLHFLAAREEDFSHYTVELLASNGRLRYEQGGKVIDWHGTQPDPNFHGYTVLAPQAESIRSGRDRYQWHVVDQLAAAIGGTEAHLCTGADALATLESMHQVLGMP